MKPLNKKERSFAFLRIAGLFIICLAISLILGFTLMDFNSLSENASSRELDKINAEIQYQEENFEPALEGLNNVILEILDKKKKNENIDQELADLPASITEIKTGIPEEHSWKPLYLNILQTYSDLQSTLKEQVNMMNELDRSSGAGEELNRLRAENTQLKGQIETLGKQSSGSSEFKNKYLAAQSSIDSLKSIISEKDFLIKTQEEEISRYKK